MGTATRWFWGKWCQFYVEQEIMSALARVWQILTVEGITFIISYRTLTLLVYKSGHFGSGRHK